MKARSRPLVVAVWVGVVVLAGCGGGGDVDPAPTVARPQAPLDYSFRWVPNPALDLMSPEGTFVRAALESYRVASYSPHRGMGAIDDAYPGYAAAFRRLYDKRGPDRVFPSNSPYNGTVGTAYFEVIALEHAGGRYTATVCRYPEFVSGSEIGGTYSHDAGGPYGMGDIWVFGPDPQLSAEQQQAPPGNQKGAARRPAGNVFGTWIIYPETETTVYIGPRCLRRAPGSDLPYREPGDNPALVIDHTPPPVLSPSPGWPDKAAL